MSIIYQPFKEVVTANPGSDTRYGSDDLLDIMRIFNAKLTLNKRPRIINPWRFSGPVDFEQVTTPPAPLDSNTIILYNDAADNKLKVKKSGGLVVDLEESGTGTWNNIGAETIENKTIPIESNFIKHSTTNFVGDIMVYDGTRYSRKSKGAPNQVLSVNPAGTDLEWITVSGAGGGGGAGGEANTASNIGTAGIGLFAQKLGIDLQFKKIFSPQGTVFITDNPANERIDIDLPTSIVTVNKANTYGDFAQTFRSSRLRVTNPANTFAYNFVGAALTGASRNVSLPLISADDTFAMLLATQTMINKDLQSGCTFSMDTNVLKHSTTNGVGDLLRNDGSRFARFARGGAGTYLRVNSGGTDLEYGALPTLSPGPLDSMTDVVITTPAAAQVLRHNGTNWVNALSLLNDPSDVVITTPAAGQFLKFDGTNWVNAALPAAPAATVRESLESTLGPGGVDGLGDAYEDALNSYVPFTDTALGEGTKTISPIDFTGKTQFKISMSLVVDGNASINVKIVDDATPGNTLREFTGITSSTQITALAALPGWATGVKVLRLQMGGGDNVDAGVSNCQIFLK